MTDPVLVATVDDLFLEELFVEALGFHGVEYYTKEEKHKGFFSSYSVTAFYVERRDLEAALSAYDEACCFYIDEMDEEFEDDDLF